MEKLIQFFATLNSEQIRLTRLNQYDDDALLDVYGHFDENGDDERAAAVLEVILHSLDHGEMVAYDELFAAVTEYAYAAGDWQALVRWTYARLAYGEHHEQGADRILIWTQLAGAYLKAGDPDTGLTLYARCLETDPNDLELYEIAASKLDQLGQRDLGLEVAARGVRMAGIVADDATTAYYQGVYDDLAAASEETIAPSVPAGPAVAAAFRRALTAEHDEFDRIGYAPPIDRLLASGGGDDAPLHAEILAQGRILAADLIRLAFDPDFDQSPASRTAIDLLRQLQRSQVVELDELQHFLELAHGDWHPLLSNYFGKFGPYSTDEIEAVALDVTVSVFVRSHAVTALRQRAEKLPGERERVVAILRTLITRREAIELPAEEGVVADAISEAVDLKATELYPEIEQAFREDRVDPEILDLRFVREQWGLPVLPEQKQRQDGLYLPLECRKCGRTRSHFVQHVFLDLGTSERQSKGEKVKYDPYVMDREIVCPKCGTRDRYHLGTMAMLQLFGPESSADLAAALSGHPEQAKMRLDPRVRVATSTAFGQLMHPIEALERYKMLILTHPKRAENHIRMGKILRILHRSTPALASIRRGQELEPDNIEYCLERALAEHDLGDKAQARALYDKVIRLASKFTTRDELMLEAAAWATQSQAALKRGQPSLWHTITFGAP